jgi:4-amino-4-deoxy-L-arabinose transferase-like glycosyltransferase
MQGKRLVAYGLFFAALFLMFLLMSLGKRLDHDEHQFVASGALLARRGLWPYRDYAYFHMPNLAIINAIAFGVSDHLLLSSRLVSMTAGLLTTVLIFFAVRGAFGFAPRVRDGAAALAVLALVCNPIFITTTGRAWNHDLPTFLTVAAFLCAVRGLRRDRSTLMVGLSGALLGLAIGTRLTFAPAALSFGAMVAIAPGKSPRAKAGLILVLGAGIAVALLPSWVLFAQAPREFIFGNFTYASLNTRFHEEGGLGRGMTLPGKLGYVFSDLLIKPGNLLLFMALAASLAGVWKYKRRTPHPHRFEMLSLIFVIGGLLVGSFAPAPLFPVYFYEPVPFAVLLVAYAAAGAPGTGAARAGARGY